MIIIGHADNSGIRFCTIHCTDCLQLLCGILREPACDAKGEQVAFTQEEFYRAYYEPICELFLDKESGLSLHGANAEIALTVPYFSEKHEEPEERKIRIGISRKLLQALMEEEYFVRNE